MFSAVSPPRCSSYGVSEGGSDPLRRVRIRPLPLPRSSLLSLSDNRQRGHVINRREQKEKGQALVEFAVILPVLLMVLWGIFQFGIAFNDYIQVTSAAREGARKAAVSRSLGAGAASSAAISAAQAVAPDLHLSASQITVTPANNWQA